MSYTPDRPSCFFYAHNDTKQTRTVGQLFALSDFVNVAEGSLTGQIDLRNREAYLYGEIQTDVTATDNNYDIDILNNSLLPCDGFQCKNTNPVGAMDDGTHGLVINNVSAIRFANRYSAGAESSDAYQTRLFGVYL